MESLVMANMKFSKKLCLVVLSLFISALFMADGYAAEKYDIKLVNGKTLKGYYLFRSKDDPSILVAKTILPV